MQKKSPNKIRRNYKKNYWKEDSLTVLHLEVELMALFAIVDFRLMLHMAERAVSVVRSLVRIWLQSLGFCENIIAIVALQTCIFVRIHRVLHVRPMTRLARNSKSNVPVRAKLCSRCCSSQTKAYGQDHCGKTKHVYKLLGVGVPKGRTPSEIITYQQPLNSLAVRAATRPKIMQSATATVPRRTMPCTPPVTSPAA